MYKRAAVTKYDQSMHMSEGCVRHPSGEWTLLVPVVVLLINSWCDMYTWVRQACTVRSNISSSGILHMLRLADSTVQQWLGLRRCGAKP